MEKSSLTQSQDGYRSSIVSFKVFHDSNLHSSRVIYHSSFDINYFSSFAFSLCLDGSRSGHSFRLLLLGLTFWGEEDDCPVSRFSAFGRVFDQFLRVLARVHLAGVQLSVTDVDLRRGLVYHAGRSDDG